MQFLVVGTDGPAFVYEESDRHEAHQQYMDDWSGALIARGPTLTPDGADHTGSVHVVDVADAGVARQFAVNEPYAQAGWYADVSITPLAPCVDGRMWDRPKPAADQPAAFVRATWTAEPATDAVRRQLATADDPPWLFAGLALSDDDGRVVGLAGAIDLAPAEARRRIEALVGSAAVDVHRWTRGGRPEGP
ncbi:MAG TPA: YciI family protein [Jatrophihabitantaceae bacterium]|jgi:hypothetical protein